MDLQSKKHNSKILQHTVKTSNNFVHISARYLEELSWIYFQASFLELVVPTPAGGFKSSLQRNNDVKKRLIWKSTTPSLSVAQEEAEH